MLPYLKIEPVDTNCPVSKHFPPTPEFHTSLRWSFWSDCKYPDCKMGRKAGGFYGRKNEEEGREKQKMNKGISI